VGLLLVHLGGVALACVGLREAWRYRLLLQILADHSLPLKVLHLPWSSILVWLSLVVALGALDSAAIVRRLMQGQRESDLGLRWRGVAYTIMGCVLFNALVLSTPESFSGPFRVRFPVLAYLSIPSAYGVYALWTLMLPWLRGVVPSRARRGMDLALMNLAVLLVLAELGLRVLASVWASPILVTSGTPPEIRRTAGRQAPGSLSFGFPMNSLGFYDTEFAPPTATRGKVVASIGDSFSYGVVPHAYHYTTVAERALPGVAIYNMGFPNTGPSDYLYLLQRQALPLRPDLVVVEIFLGNDVSDFPQPAGPSRWYDADRYLSAVVWHRLGVMRRAKRIDPAKVAEEQNQKETELAARYPWVTDPLREPPGMDKEVYLQLELRNALSVCAPGTLTYPIFLKTLALIKQAAGDVPLAFVLIPDEFQVEDSLWQAITRRTDLRLERDRPQQVTVDWIKERGWPVLDLLPRLRDVPPMADGRRHLYHRQDTHFNARGNQLAGKALAQFVDSLMKTDVKQHEAGVRAAAAVPAISLPIHLVLGDSTVRRWIGTGWQEGETSGGRSFSWSEGNRSVLNIPLPTGADIRMDFQALPFTYSGSPQQHVTVVLNGAVVQDVPIADGLQQYSVTLPAAQLQRGLQTLELRYGYARAPRDVSGSQDERVLAVAWYGIDFAPAK
jgi:hypothetical protein